MLPNFSEGTNAPDLSQRIHQQELMDGPCTYEEFRGALRSLNQINALTLGYRPTLEFLNRVRMRATARPLHILDVGSGGGDMLRRIRRWARRWNVDVRLTGIDLNPFAERAAREFEMAGENIRWVTGDALLYRPDEPVDIVLSSLVAHHLNDVEVVEFLRWMTAASRIGWFINDLHRQWLPYAIIGPFARLMRWHRFVWYDAPLSFLRSFRYADWARLVSDARLEDGQTLIQAFRPARLCVSFLKP